LFAFVLQSGTLFADTDGMTLPLIGRRRVATPRRIVSVTDYWTRNPETGELRRRVLVCEAGRLVHVLLRDDHPALVAYLRDRTVQDAA
jgi:hypothetical protein